MSINKINGSVSDTLSKVNGTNDALLSNMLAPSNLAIAPMINSHSVVFNGTSNWLDLDAVVGAISTEAGTVALWFKMVTDQISIFWKCNSNTLPAQNYIQIYFISSNDKVKFQQEYGNSEVSYTTTATVNDGAWHFAAMSWTTDGFTAYLDTETSAVSGQSGEAPTMGKCAAGKNSLASGTTYYLGGHMNEIAMWDAALDADAIAAVYNSGKGINLTRDVGNYDNASDLIGYWKMEENTGTTVVDSSGNGETGTLSHSSLFSTDTI
jgi:hypothetical protein